MASTDTCANTGPGRSLSLRYLLILLSRLFQGALLHDLFGLQGRVAYVTGGYGDIGSAIARGLAMAGARVAISGRSAEKAQALAAALRAEGCDAMGLAMDAHHAAEIASSVDRVASHFGHLDLLINCVGIQREERLAGVTEAAFDEVVQVNL